MTGYDFSLRDKNILVTGASSGIGKVIAIELSKAGANLTITGRNQERLVQTFQLLDRSYGQEHLSAILDFADTASIDTVDIGSHSFDGIVLAAGVNVIIPFSFLSKDILDNVMNSNFTGNILLLKRLIQRKLFNKNGSVVFISSINGTTIGSKGHSIYAASKGAINGMMRSLANELSKQSIRVNAISPGLIHSGMFEQNSDVLSKEDLDKYVKRYPLGIGKPEDIAYSCIFLLSKASRWITGQTIIVDGGISINN